MFQRNHIFREPRQDRPFRRGDFKYVILHYLKDKPSCGYDIIRALEERFHGFYIPSPGAVYPTLQMLEEAGYINGVEEGGKKVYTITDEGHGFLSENKDFEEKIKNHLENWWNPENIDDKGAAMHEFRRFAQLLGEKVRTADTAKLGRIRKVISSAYEGISKE